MKNKTELVRGWLRKAKSNVDALDAAHGAGVYDAACFHAQAVEEAKRSVAIVKEFVLERLPAETKE